MNSKRFVIADVFTEKQFGGNQLAVFTDGSGLDAVTMQNIAREMNYSETTFLLPPENGGDYRIRIFTPASELPFAGHPLVGSAFVIVSEGMKQKAEPLTSLTIEAVVGPIHVEVQTAGGLPGRTTMTQPLPVVRGQYTNVPALAKALGDSVVAALAVDTRQLQTKTLPLVDEELLSYTMSRASEYWGIDNDVIPKRKRLI